MVRNDQGRKKEERVNVESHDKERGEYEPEPNIKTRRADPERLKPIYPGAVVPYVLRLVLVVFASEPTSNDREYTTPDGLRVSRVS
jgi:hypothetical protein